MSEHMKQYYKFIKNATNFELEFIKNLINTEPNDVTLLYFSESNINNLNNKIIKEIEKQTENDTGKPVKIQSQKKELMLQMMRYVYFTNIKYRLPTKEEVLNLNNEFLKIMIPHVYKSLKSYLKYMDDIKKIQISELPENTSNTKGDLKPLSSVFGF